MKKKTRVLPLLLALLLAPGLVLAENLRVNLQDHRGRPLDGQVTATPRGGGKAVRCTTRGGRCTLRVSAGRYSVRAKALRGARTKAKTVTVRRGRTATATLKANAPGKRAKSAKNRAARSGRNVKNLGSGRVACVRGNTQDARGRPMDGTVTFKRGERTIGRVSTRGGRFVAYDLGPGSYSLVFRSASGRTGRATVRVRRGRAVTKNIRVQ